MWKIDQNKDVQIWHWKKIFI